MPAGYDTGLHLPDTTKDSTPAGHDSGRISAPAGYDTGFHMLDMRITTHPRVRCADGTAGLPRFVGGAPVEHLRDMPQDVSAHRQDTIT